MNKTALITGASGGIGKDLAYKFAENEYDVVLVARSEDKLAAIAADIEAKHHVQARVIPLDLANSQAPQMLYDQLQGTPVDVLVNNAGFASYGYFHETSTEEEMGMIQVNITTLTHLTHLFLPDMVARRSGKIMNVASIASFVPGPLMAVYYATKAYVLSFSEAIANEVADKGITVTALCPGATESGFQERASLHESKLLKNPIMRMMTSEEVAEAGYNGLMKGKAIVVPGIINKLTILSPRFFPRGMAVRITRQMQERA